jgi:hypothetical protein
MTVAHVVQKVYKGLTPHRIKPVTLSRLSLEPCERSIFIQYPELVLSLLVAPRTRRTLDDTVNHHPNPGTLQPFCRIIGNCADRLMTRSESYDFDTRLSYRNSIF